MAEPAELSTSETDQSHGGTLTFAEVLQIELDEIEADSRRMGGFVLMLALVFITAAVVGVWVV